MLKETFCMLNKSFSNKTYLDKLFFYENCKKNIDITGMNTILKKFQESEQDPNSDLVVQHNNLIQARYRLTLQEKRLVLWLASQVNLNDKDFKEHTLNVRDFARIADISEDGLYSDLQAITKRLMQRIITIRDIEKSHLIQVAWLGAAKYEFNKGTVDLSFHPHLKPFMLELKKNFTILRLSDVLSLKSIYAIRIFELLKQYEEIGRRTVKLEELKELCGIKPEQYQMYHDFKRKVLDIAVREINEKTPISIKYQEVKSSRKITEICFSISTNRDYLNHYQNPITFERIEKLEREMASKNLLVEKICEYGFGKKTAQNFFNIATEKEIKEALRAIELQIEKGHVRNTKALVRAAIKERWHPEVFRSKKKSG